LDTSILAWREFWRRIGKKDRECEWVEHCESAQHGTRRSFIHKKAARKAAANAEPAACAAGSVLPVIP